MNKTLVILAAGIGSRLRGSKFYGHKNYCFNA